jgi:hypothetical protein
MTRRHLCALATLCALWAHAGTPALAQSCSFPGGFGEFGWGGWGVGTVEGDVAAGLGDFAAGLGFYEKMSAIGHAIELDTVIRWNEYLNASAIESNRRRLARSARESERNAAATEGILKRLRDNPEARDIASGDALNIALQEIDNPKVYRRALKAAGVKIGGDTVRKIPFRYAAAAIEIGIHHLATGAMPRALLRPEFEADRQKLKELDQALLDQVDDDKDPDPTTVKKLLEEIYAFEEKASKVLTGSTLERTQAERYLKALHGLVAMLNAPALEPALAGVEKRPDTTLGELIRFMSVYNLRFGKAKTPAQREIYRSLYSQLVQVRNEVAPLVASAKVPKTTGSEAEDFFAAMTDADLHKKSPKP